MEETSVPQRAPPGCHGRRSESFWRERESPMTRSPPYLAFQPGPCDDRTMAHPASANRMKLGVAAGLVAVLVAWRTCSKDEPVGKGGEGAGASSTAASKTAPGSPGLSAPIAAAHAG